MTSDDNLTQHNKSPEAFRTISEASEEVGVPPHVLRFWEGKFSNLKPLKRAGGRRFYRPQDILLMRGLKYLLQDQGITIRGVQKLIKERGIQSIRDAGNTGAQDGAGYGDFMIDDPIEAENQSENQNNSSYNAELSEFDINLTKSHPSGNSPALLRALARLEQARLLLDNAIAK